ncbi:hypothetical protein, partial [Salmonella enterica]|uniref:hypothetical protein n=1 Tax=Salmonella enterica TaxID=28901 RepID=UPI001C38341E
LAPINPPANTVALDTGSDIHPPLVVWVLSERGEIKRATNWQPLECKKPALLAGFICLLLSSLYRPEPITIQSFTGSLFK